jgi:pyridoxine 5'-phosphate synthase PdxJ
METDETLIRKAKDIGAVRIEFYTGKYFKDYPLNRENAVEKWDKWRAE